MELYHIHVLGKHDELFKNKEIIIDNNYNNELYERVMNSNYVVNTSDYPVAVNAINYYNKEQGFKELGEKDSLSLIISSIISNATSEEIKKALYDARELLHNASFMKRELSMEDYRRINEPKKPSRLHSFYACDDFSISYWADIIRNGKAADIYKIEPIDEPFKTNEQLMPLESASYIESYKEAKKYFNPTFENVTPKTNEYLIKGKVKILEKVFEMGNNK